MQKTVRLSQVHIWLVKETLIPIDRILVIPYREVGMAPKDNKKLRNLYGQGNLILVDDEMNDVLTSFSQQRIGWNAEQWDIFMQNIYPHWLVNNQFRRLA